MNVAAPFRGQPLMLLGGVLAAWAIVRGVLWQSPFPLPSAVSEVVAAARQVAAVPASPPMSGDLAINPAAPTFATPAAPAPIWRSEVRPPLWSPEPVPTFGPPAIGEPAARPVTATVPVRGAVAHNLMLFAGLSAMELPPAIVAYLQAAPTPAAGVPRAAPALALGTSPMAPSVGRWSGDSWLLLREDSGALLAAGQPGYGRSQAGAVLRYRLAHTSALRPEAHVRGAVALTGARERELASGLSARVPGLPLRVAAEARVSETAAGREVRPAVFAVTELAPVALPLGARAEAYVQGGYVGGRYATGFVDGQARVERRLLSKGETSLSAGGGVWGGAQRGAARLDVGPTANVQFRLGDARGRLAADYRFRVAGDAAPASGPALTLSAGF